MSRSSWITLATALAIWTLAEGASARAGPPEGETASASSEPRSYLVRGATLITLEPPTGGALGILRDSDVRFSDEIQEVGQKLEPGGSTVIEGKGKIVLPGFVDTHNHLWQSLIRGCGPELTLSPWFMQCVAPARSLSEGQVYWGARLSTVDLISTGVTTVVDWSHGFHPGFTEGNLRALRDSQLRFVFAYFLWEGMEHQLAVHKQHFIDGNPLGSLHVAAHPSQGGLVRILASAARTARDLGVPLNVHLLESPEQTQEAQLEVLKSVGALDQPLFVNHAVHLTEAEIDALAGADAAVAHNPLSNLRLGAGVMQIEAFGSRKIRLGLGLDGGANDTSDVFSNMRAAVGMQRARATDAAVYPSVEAVLRLATLGGAEALGLGDRIGSLRPGKRADLVVLDPRRANFAPVRDELVAQIVFNGQPRNVEAVFVDGRPLKLDGELVLDGTSEREIVRRVEQEMRGATFSPFQGVSPPPVVDGPAAEQPGAEPGVDLETILGVFNLR